MLTKDNINETLADAVMNRPREFFINERRFCIWSPSLGQSFIIQRHLSALKIDTDVVRANPSIEALRLVAQKKEQVCNLIAVYTFNRYEDFCHSKRIENRATYFSKHLSDEEIAQLLMVIFSEPRLDEYLLLSGIADEQEKQIKISHVKNENGHTLSLGGKTIFGNLLCPACEKLNLTPFQATWGIPLINLQLLLADAVTSVYLSDEELKKCKITNKSTFVNADDPANASAILKQDWS